MAVERRRQLSAAELEALTTLEERVVSADGGRLKLEWGVLRKRPRTEARDFLWRERGRLVGFLGLYAFAADRIEITGMVDPAFRRDGIATALLDAALPVCRQHHGETVLLVVPRRSEPGRQLALARGATLEHSEHALVLEQQPQQMAREPRVTLRAAMPNDLGVISDLIHSGFGHPATSGQISETERSQTRVADLDGSVIGTVRLSKDGQRGGVYGFVIDQRLRGRGLGRQVLSQACTALFDAGATSVGLEVASDNDRALGLYTSLGFRRISTEDYYELVL